MVGPGIFVSWQSDFIGPIETGSTWLFSITTDSEGNIGVYDIRIPASTVLGSHTMFTTQSAQSVSQFRLQPQEGDQVFVQVKLLAPNGLTVIDSGTQTAPWRTTQGLGEQLLEKTTTGGAGLTPEQSLQLSQTHTATWADQLLDNITLIPLTAGPSQGPVNANLLDTTFGVIIRLATVPEEFQPQTPDGDYWVKTLAVVRIYRGSDMWKRYPIHTSSKLVSFLDESIVASVTALTATQWMLNMTMQVTFLPGVTGSVFLMRFP